MQIKQILLLHTQGYSERKISKQLCLSRNTVRKYLTIYQDQKINKEELLSLPEEKLGAHFDKKQDEIKERYGELIAYFPEVLKCSKQTGFTYKKMWERYCERSARSYSYAQFLVHYRKWNNQSDATLKLTHKVGEVLMVDYAGKKLEWVDKHSGLIHEVEVFIGCLPASGYTFVEASPSQKKTDYIQSMINCLNYLGGSPEVIISDNLKSAVDKSCKYEAVANRTFRDMALHYGSVLNPTRPYRPKDKAMVERMVRLVYEQIYFVIGDETFFSLHQLNERILELLEDLNNRKYKQLDCSRKELFLNTEHPHLKPLPPQPYLIKHFKRAKVQKTSHVYLSEDKHYYSVPYRFIGKGVRLHYSSRVVEIYHHNQRIASHLRDRTASGYTTKKEHLPSHHQFYLDWSPSMFINKAKQIGPYTTQYIERLFKQNGYAETKYKTAMGIIQLRRQYEAERIEKGCRLAIMHPISSYQRILNILQKGLDQSVDLFENQTKLDSHIPLHENIRGAQYYNQLNFLNKNSLYHASDN